MLIEQVARLLGTQLISGAFGLGSSESCAISFGPFCRLLPLAALLEPFQIDYFPHRRHLRSRQFFEGMKDVRNRYPLLRYAYSPVRSSFAKNPHLNRG